MKPKPLLLAGVLALAAVLAWVLFVGLPRWTRSPDPGDAGAQTAPAVAPAVSTASAANTRRIRVRLYYATEDGARLQAVEADVEFAERTADQARRIVEAQLQPAAAPLIAAVPEGTSVREVFITGDGVAFIDLGGTIASGHPGGTRAEMLTVYSLVNALTVNLPAVRAVQLLVEGREVDTLAGHVDLRRPLEANLALVDQPDAARAAADAPARP